MSSEKKRSKGGFLYLFDWKAKSRKKLFSNTSQSSGISAFFSISLVIYLVGLLHHDLTIPHKSLINFWEMLSLVIMFLVYSEAAHLPFCFLYLSITCLSNQGKESADNLVISQYNLRKPHESKDHSSFRGSDNCSGTSSVNGDEEYGTKAPGLVARLMGLDSMPTTSCEASSIASYDTHATGSSYYPEGVAKLQYENRVVDYSYASNKLEDFTWSSMDNRTNQIHGRLSKRFQTEILPPKSAKPISITHHKLLSPIKSPGFVPTKDAAYIMEAASRIIDSSPHPSSKMITPSLNSPSSSFRLHDLKEKIDVARRSSKLLESSQTPKKSPYVLQKRGNFSEGSSSRSLFRNNMGSETSCSEKVRNKGKPVSLHSRDKAKMHRTEGSAYCDNRSRENEIKEVKLKHKQMSTRNPVEHKTFGIKSSGVLRQNNDKQNNVARKDKSSLKTAFSDHQPRKYGTGDNSVGPSKIISRVFVNGENGSKKVVTPSTAIDKRARLNGVTDKTPLCSKMKSVSRNKQSVVRENVPSNSEEGSAKYSHSSCQSNSGKDLDIISFTFTSPIKKSGAQSLSPIKAIGSNHHHLGADCPAINDQADKRSSNSPPSGLNVTYGGSLSLLLEQKLKELTNKLVSKQSVMEGCSNAGTITMDYNQWTNKDQTSHVSFVSKSRRKLENFENVEEHATNGTNKCEASRESDLVHLNILIPECSISGSFMSSSTTSDFTYGYDEPSSPQSQEVISSISTESIHTREDETDFTDATSSGWELEYVRHVLHYAGLNRFWFDKHYKTIDPAVFDLLENLINTSGRNTDIICSKLDRRTTFDCISESVSSRYERVCIGSQKSRAKWEMLLHNDCLTEDLFKEVIGFQRLGGLMVDEVVDIEMSSGYGKWLDFEIESLEEGIEIEEDIVASLIDELVYGMCTELL